MKKLAVLSCLISIQAYAGVDYSKCSSPMSGVSFDSDGQVVLGPGQKIKSKSTDGNKETYVINSDYSAFGGTGNNDQKITIERDKQGRVINMITGGDSLTESEIQKLKQTQLEWQVSSTVTGADMAFGNFQSMGGFGHPLMQKTTISMEPMYFVKNKDGNVVYKKLRDLSKDEYKQMGLNAEEFSDLKKKVRSDKRLTNKFRKSLKKIQDKSSPVFYLGQESHFEIKDNTCFPVEVSTRMYHSSDKTIKNIPQFSKEACDEVDKIYAKHKSKIATCDGIASDISKDLQENYKSLSKLNSGIGGYGMGIGYPGGGMMGGFGIASATSGQLGQLKMSCDMYLLRYNQDAQFGGSSKSDDGQSAIKY